MSVYLGELYEVTHEVRLEYLLSCVDAVFRLADTFQGVTATVLVRVPTDSTSEREIASTQRLAAVDALGADTSGDHEESE